MNKSRKRRSGYISRLAIMVRELQDYPHVTETIKIPWGWCDDLDKCAKEDELSRDELIVCIVGDFLHKNKKHQEHGS